MFKLSRIEQKMNNEEVLNLVRRIDTIKDVDPDYSRLLNDCHEAFLYLLTELAISRQRYNQALQTIHDNNVENN